MGATRSHLSNNHSILGVTLNSIRYQYVSTRNRRHPVTIAYSTSECDLREEITVTVGASFCHKSDRFNRHRGREIAEGRMNRVPFRFTIPFDRKVTTAYGKTVSDGLRKFFEENEYKISMTYSRSQRD